MEPIEIKIRQIFIYDTLSFEDLNAFIGCEFNQLMHNVVGKSDKKDKYIGLKDVSAPVKTNSIYEYLRVSYDALSQYNQTLKNGVNKLSHELNYNFFITPDKETVNKDDKELTIKDLKFLFLSELYFTRNLIYCLHTIIEETIKPINVKGIMQIPRFVVKGTINEQILKEIEETNLLDTETMEFYLEFTTISLKNITDYFKQIIDNTLENKIITAHK